MTDIARGVLAGIAIGGFTAAVVKINRLVLDALTELNIMATEMALDMGRAAWIRIKLKRFYRSVADEAVKDAVEASCERMYQQQQYANEAEDSDSDDESET